MLASLAPGETRIIGASGARHVRSTIEVLRGLGTRIEQDETGFVVHGGPYRPRRSLGVRRQLGHHPLLHDRPRGARRRARDADGPEVLPAPARRSAARRAGAARGAPGVAGRPAADHRPAVAAHRRARADLRDAVAVDLRAAPAGAVRHAADRHRGRRRAQRAALPRADRAHDARVRAGGRASPTTGGASRSSPARRRQATEIVLPPDIGSAAFGLAASALHPSDVLFRGMRTTLGTEIDHPEAHVLDVLTEMGLPMELDEEAGGVRVRHDGIELRGVRRRLPADARHAADPRDARVLRDRPDRVRERRARPPEGVRPRRLHAAAQPDGRRGRARRRHARHRRACGA